MLPDLLSDSQALALAGVVPLALFLLTRRRHVLRREARLREEEDMRRLIRRAYRSRPATAARHARVWVDRDGYRWN